MVRIILKSGLVIACLLALVVFVPRANASAIDYSCGGVVACTGTVTSSGGLAFSTTGIGLGSSFDGTDMFTATFTTNSSGTGSMTISDADGDMLSGTIVGTSESSFHGHETLVLHATWTTMSPTVEAALGGTTGVGQSTGSSSCRAARLSARISV